jgi:pimeloyl-ACP methyl ester carboxylesterase
MPRASINDLPIYYDSSGKGEPLVFLHGLGSSSADWQLQVEYFRDQYQCITSDTRGHGRSGKPPGPYSVAQFASDTAGLLDYLGMAGVHLIGLSMGGSIAFQMAVDYPERVKSMVIINSAPAVVPSNFSEKLKIWQRQYLFRILSMERIGKTIGARLFPKPDQKPLLDEFVVRWSKNDKKAYMAATMALVGWSVLDRIASIKAPTLVIASDNDYTPVTAKEEYVARMPNAELLVIEDARHAVCVAQPEKVNPAIEAFLKRVIGESSEITESRKIDR